MEKDVNIKENLSDNHEDEVHVSRSKSMLKLDPRSIIEIENLSTENLSTENETENLNTENETSQSSNEEHDSNVVQNTAYGSLRSGSISKIPSNQISGCAISGCNQERNMYMLECSKCKSMTHYGCTELPPYQVSLFMLTSYRLYICNVCVGEIPEEILNYIFPSSDARQKVVITHTSVVTQATITYIGSRNGNWT